MPIERKAPQKRVRRQVSDLLEKHARIGDLMRMKPVPTHTLSWKETRLDLEGGDCHPLIDVIEKMAIVLSGLLESEMQVQGQKSADSPAPAAAKKPPAAKPKAGKKGK